MTRTRNKNWRDNVGYEAQLLQIAGPLRGRMVHASGDSR